MLATSIFSRQPAFSFFPIFFFPLPKRNFNFLATYILSSANALNLDKPRILSLYCKQLTLYSIDTHFNASITDSFWEKKNFLIKSNFFFSHNVFYSIRKLYPHLSTFLTSYFNLLLNCKSPKLACEVKG